MNDDHSPDRFERHLVDLLDERAGRIVVEPDLAALSRSGNITEAAPDAVRLNRLTQPIAVAAALVVVAMLWGYLARGNAPAEDVAVINLAGAVAPTPPRLGVTGNSVFDEWDANLIIWMTPTASPEEIELVARQLDEVEQFAPYTYVDADATYAEFRRYYADQPEVIELVEKEQLPTSFRVRTSMVAEVQGLVEGNNAVSGIEVAG